MKYKSYKRKIDCELGVIVENLILKIEFDVSPNRLTLVFSRFEDNY